jgi:hypothetical protein
MNVKHRPTTTLLQATKQCVPVVVVGCVWRETIQFVRRSIVVIRVHVIATIVCEPKIVADKVDANTISNAVRLDLQVFLSLVSNEHCVI